MINFLTFIFIKCTTWGTKNVEKITLKRPKATKSQNKGKKTKTRYIPCFYYPFNFFSLFIVFFFFFKVWLFALALEIYCFHNRNNSLQIQNPPSNSIWVSTQWRRDFSSLLWWNLVKTHSLRAESHQSFKRDRVGGRLEVFFFNSFC